MTINLNVGVLKVVGDSKIVIQQVHNIIHCVLPNLKGYQQELWHLISQLQTSNIIYVPRMRNTIADALANYAARFSPLRDDFSIEILYKPSILDNITNLHTFNDDQ